MYKKKKTNKITKDYLANKTNAINTIKCKKNWTKTEKLESKNKIEQTKKKHTK